MVGTLVKGCRCVTCRTVLRESPLIFVLTSYISHVVEKLSLTGGVLASLMLFLTVGRSHQIKVR